MAHSVFRNVIVYVDLDHAENSRLEMHEMQARLVLLLRKMLSQNALVALVRQKTFRIITSLKVESENRK
jgi:hypothetical protein